MKEYVVRYHLGAYVYESVVKTSSSHAALLWVKAIGGYNPVIVSEPNEWYEKVVDP